MGFKLIVVLASFFACVCCAKSSVSDLCTYLFGATEYNGLYKNSTEITHEFYTKNKLKLWK